MKKTSLIALMILTVSTAFSPLQAWYPEYTVLATDFPVRGDFLKPLSLTSTASQGMGPYFKYLYANQPDFRFLDPTSSLTGKRQIFYIDLGSERLWSRNESGSVISMPYYDDFAYGRDYGFWSPYRDLSHEQAPEPALRLFYLNRLGEDPGALTVGGSYSLAYDETEFYQPYDYNYFRSFDAMGGAYEDAAVYDDYRLREAGDDESISTEHQVNLFLSKALSSRLTLGARLGLLRADVDGTYRDFQFEDRSQWVDIYEYYMDDDLQRIQSQKMNDFNLGLAYTTAQDHRFAINAGLTDGSLERSFVEFDTTRYHSIYLNPDENSSTLDSNIYRSTSYYTSDKNWLYDGAGRYIRALVELPRTENLTLRFGGLAEWRSADLTESESMLRRSDYYNQYYSDYYGRWQRYSSRSMSTVERQGTGTFTSSVYQLSGGVDWELQQGLTLYGGLYLEHSDRLQDSREPFVGAKSAENTLQGYDAGYETLSSSQTDQKIFIWEQHRWSTTLAAPLAIEYRVMPALSIQLGLTKIFQRSRVEEGYDVIIEEYTHREIQDGVTIIDESESDYVDGYQYPVIKDFDNRFDFNAGVNLHAGDRLRISVALTDAYDNELAIKVGGSISW